MADFINRKEEITFFNDWFKSEPNALLFVYGPKSCGKSTLLLKLLQSLDKKKFVANYLDLRGILLYDFKSFLDTFFQKSNSDKLRGLIDGLSINTGFFTVGIEEEGLMKRNPFKVMENQLAAANKKGKRPIIIIDEIQMLKGIYVNKDRFLIDELLNFFVRLTKVTHLAHVILLTSDSFFISKLYQSSKLNKTAEYYRMEHFSKSVVSEWLSTKNMTDKEINYIWKYLGGSPWEISRFLEKRDKDASTKEIVQNIINEEYYRISRFFGTNEFTTEQKKVVEVVHQTFAKKGFANMGTFSVEIHQLIEKMVQSDIWFFEADTQKITPNSKSIYWAIKKSLNN